MSGRTNSLNRLTKTGITNSILRDGDCDVTLLKCIRSLETVQQQLLALIRDPNLEESWLHFDETSGVSSSNAYIPGELQEEDEEEEEEHESPEESHTTSSSIHRNNTYSSVEREVSKKQHARTGSIKVAGATKTGLSFTTLFYKVPVVSRLFPLAVRLSHFVQEYRELVDSFLRQWEILYCQPNKRDPVDLMEDYTEITILPLTIAYQLTEELIFEYKRHLKPLEKDILENCFPSPLRKATSPYWSYLPSLPVIYPQTSSLATHTPEMHPSAEINSLNNSSTRNHQRIISMSHSKIEALTKIEDKTHNKNSEEKEERTRSLNNPQKISKDPSVNDFIKVSPVVLPLHIKAIYRNEIDERFDNTVLHHGGLDYEDVNKLMSRYMYFAPVSEKQHQKNESVDNVAGESTSGSVEAAKDIKREPPSNMAANASNTSLMSIRNLSPDVATNDSWQAKSPLVHEPVTCNGKLLDAKVTATYPWIRKSMLNKIGYSKASEENENIPANNDVSVAGLPTSTTIGTGLTHRADNDNDADPFVLLNDPNADAFFVGVGDGFILGGVADGSGAGPHARFAGNIAMGVMCEMVLRGGSAPDRTRSYSTRMKKNNEQSREFSSPFNTNTRPIAKEASLSGSGVLHHMKTDENIQTNLLAVNSPEESEVKLSSEKMFKDEPTMDDTGRRRHDLNSGKGFDPHCMKTTHDIMSFLESVIKKAHKSIVDVDEAGATTVVYYVLSKLDVQAAFSDPSYVEANPGCRMFLERKGEQGLGADKDFYVMNYAIAGDTEAFWFDSKVTNEWSSLHHLPRFQDSIRLNTSITPGGIGKHHGDRNRLWGTYLWPDPGLQGCHPSMLTDFYQYSNNVHFGQVICHSDDFFIFSTDGLGDTLDPVQLFPKPSLIPGFQKHASWFSFNSIVPNTVGVVRDLKEMTLNKILQPVMFPDPTALTLNNVFGMASPGPNSYPVKSVLDAPMTPIYADSEISETRKMPMPPTLPNFENSSPTSDRILLACLNHAMSVTRCDRELYANKDFFFAPRWKKQTMMEAKIYEWLDKHWIGSAPGSLRLQRVGTRDSTYSRRGFQSSSGTLTNHRSSIMTSGSVGSSNRNAPSGSNGFRTERSYALPVKFVPFAKVDHLGIQVLKVSICSNKSGIVE